MGTGVQMAKRQEQENLAAAPTAAPEGKAVAVVMLRQFARRLYNERRLRDTVLDATLMGEAAWDLLLDLYASVHEERPITISSACIAAAVPPTTALRYIEALQARGLLITEKRSADRRLRLVRLTPLGESRMTDLLSRMCADRRIAGQRARLDPAR